MKISVGNDLVENSKILHVYEEFGEKFLKKVYHPEEIEYCLSKKNPIPFLAARFAAKEAFIKALTLPNRVQLNWQEIFIAGNYFGKKELEIIGRAREIFQSKGFENISTSITHTENFACAVVILY